MSTPSETQDAPPPSRPRVLVRLRTYLILLLAAILLMLSAMWWLGVGLEDGKAVIASLLTILFFATLGEFLRQRCRVSLRGFLFAFTVLAILLGMLSQRLLEARMRSAVVARLQQGGARVDYDYNHIGDDWVILSSGNTIPAWPRDFLGDDHFASVTRIGLYNSNTCRDADFVGIGSLVHLEYLAIDLAPVTDRVLIELAGLQKLEGIMINGSQATESGMKALAEIPGLRELSLRGPGVTDATLERVKHVPQLRMLFLWDTRVTEGRVNNLRRELPHVNVWWKPAEW